MTINTDLEVALRDLSAAVASLCDFARSASNRDFGELTYKAWDAECNRLCWLADRLEEHAAEAHRAYHGEPEPEPTGPVNLDADAAAVIRVALLAGVRAHGGDVEPYDPDPGTATEVLAYEGRMREALKLFDRARGVEPEPAAA